MGSPYSEEDRNRFESYRSVHLKKEQQSLPPEEQVKALHKRDRAKWWHLAVNIAALIAFAYSFYYNITRLSETLFIIICVVFGINVILIFYQKRQIRETIDYIEWKMREEEGRASADGNRD